MRNEIILIGPMLAGKSTTALILSEHLNKPVVNFDEIKWNYFSSLGLTRDYADEILIAKGVQELVKFYSPYEARIVAPILSDYNDCIFDMGAGFTVYEDEALQLNINNILEKYKNIFLVLPSDDNNLNERIYCKRLKDRITADPILADHYESLLKLSIYFSNHLANTNIAKHILYTRNANEYQIVSQVLKKI